MPKKQAQSNSPVYLTQKRVAELLNLNVETVRCWCRSGKMACVRFSAGVIRIPLWAVFPPEAIQPPDRPGVVLKEERADAPGQTFMQFRECS